MKIGERIKRRRKELQWSQRDLAEKMGYNHSTITRIETGKIDIPQSRIVQFSEVMGVTTAYLMGWENEKDPTVGGGVSEKRQALIDFAKSVQEEKAEMLLRVMKTILKGE